MLTDNELMRYSRQLLLPGFEIDAQLALKNSRVLIVGSGGLGCPAALYLAGAGVGELVLADDDSVEMANLQRQIAFTEPDLDTSKAEALATRVGALNRDCRATPLKGRLDGASLDEAVQGATLVLDCSDNFDTRFAVNRACVQARVPLVSGAAIRGEGQLSVFQGYRADAPCYQCLYPDGAGQDLRCSESGVIGPLVGMIGAAQAMEAIKVLTGHGQSLTGRLLLLDAWRMEWREMKLGADPECPVCAVAEQQ